MFIFSLRGQVGREIPLVAWRTQSNPSGEHLIVEQSIENKERVVGMKRERIRPADGYQYIMRQTHPELFFLSSSSIGLLQNCSPEIRPEIRHILLLMVPE